MSEKVIKVVHDGEKPNITVVKGDKWNSIKSVDFGGAKVTLSGVASDPSSSPFSGNTTITAVSNCNMYGNMHNAFDSCTNLQKFDANMENVTDAVASFMLCGLTAVSFNMPSAICNDMFRLCTRLKTAAISADTTTSARNMFSGCSQLTSAEILAPQATECKALFHGCSALKNVVADLSSAKNTTSSGLTQNCSNIESWSGSLASWSAATNSPFSGKTKLTSVTTNLDSIVVMDKMFSGCTALTSISVVNDTLPKCTSIQSAFTNCQSLSTINLSLPLITANTATAFYKCSGLTSATLNMPKLIRFGGSFFGDCYSLKRLYITVSSGFTGATNVSADTTVLSGCSSLEHVEIIGGYHFSAKTQASYGIPTTAPCRAYRYVDDLGDGSCRLVFTSTQRPTYNITTKAIAFMADGIHYVSQDGAQELVYEGYGEEDNPINIKMTGSTILDANSSINYVNGVTMDYVAVLRITNDDNNQRLPIQIAYNGNTYNVINYSETKTIKFYNNSWVILD